MGLIYNNALLMLKAKKNGTSFKKILTLGHQKLYITDSQVKSLSRDFGVDISNFTSVYGEYSDEFFKCFLNCDVIESLDYSEYEKCNIVHDMNTAIDNKYYESYDVIIDGGALEHIFNFPVAISNCMNLVRKDGSLFIFSMANNHMGHGFYQFSPELYFRIFENNGFMVNDVVLDEHKYPGPEISPIGKCFKVKDPKLVKSRISVVSTKPLLIMVHAVRNEVQELFSSYPIQSDYTVAYETKSNSKVSSTSGIKGILKKIFRKMPENFRNFAIGKMQLKKYSLCNKLFYTKWN